METTTTTEDTCECCGEREGDTYCERCEKHICWHCTDQVVVHRQTLLDPQECADYCQDCTYAMEPDGDDYDDPDDYCDY